MIKMKVKDFGDDLFINRLFSYLETQLTIRVDFIQQVRGNVYLLYSGKEKYIVKGFPQLKKLKIQESLLHSLHQQGFTQTYTFLHLSHEMPLYFERSYYGLLPYIPHSNEPFNFASSIDRENGLELLQKFHKASANLVPPFRLMVNEFQLLTKWRERTAQFINNLSIIRFFLQAEIISEILEWADLSLKGLERHSPLFNEGEQVLLHGDVAHHNFLRSHHDSLYLIDFDLVSHGSPAYDFLQYSNRILPHLKWSYADLSKYKQIADFLHDPAFLYALVFPTDIFREWNRIVRTKGYADPSQARPVLDLTVGSFHERKDFVEKIRKKLLL